MTPQNVDAVHKLHIDGAVKTIAINEAGLRQYLPLAAPWADILYAADRAWWRHYRPDFAGMCISGEPVKEEIAGNVTYPAFPTLPLKMLERGEKMARTPGSVVSGGHSGFQALGLSLTLGASRVLLLGYDCGGSTRNCHQNRPEHFKRDANMAAWADCYDRVPIEWPDVEVINVSLPSAIRAFPKVETIEEAL